LRNYTDTLFLYRKLEFGVKRKLDSTMYNGELKTVGVVPGTNTILTGSGNMSGSGSPLGSSMTSSSSGEPSPLNTDPNAQLGPGLEGGSPGEDEVRAYYFRSFSTSGPLVLPVLFSTPSTISQKMAPIYMIQALIEDTVSNFQHRHFTCPARVDLNKKTTLGGYLRVYRLKHISYRVYSFDSQTNIHVTVDVFLLLNIK